MKNAKNYLSELRAKHGDCWREKRQTRFFMCEGGLGFNGTEGNRRKVFYTFRKSELPVRFAQFADEVVSLRHVGWFTDNNADRGTIRGIVAALPHGRFIPGYYTADNGEYVLFLDCVFDSAEDCARDADEEARILAEKECEYNARFDEANRLACLVTDKKSDLSEYFKARNVSAKQRQWAKETIAEIRDILRELETDYKGVDYDFGI